MFSIFKKNRKRQIFEYFDGEKNRRIDPIEAWRAIWSDEECNPDDDFGPAHGFDAEGNEIEHSPEALDRVLSMARRVFGITPWQEDCPGLTQGETIDLLTNFISYVAQIKKKHKI